MLNKICVFCGSSKGAKPDYANAGKMLGKALAARGISLVYGGAGIGVMGAMADAVLDGGGEVIGIMPEFLHKKEVGHTSLTEMRVVTDMHERKMLMHELADGFITLPGGFGTFDELFETLTWAQLSLHQKPCGLLNVAGYFDALTTFIQKSVDEGFVHPEHKKMLLISNDASGLLDRMQSCQNAHAGKWSQT